ncbi:Gfo/Idh/MocA family oxidoreductase [Streptomyces sp. NPDC058000]|uniref:Gfo/Idh/MocA family protein n=1 Tax=Streptomyces sp. NPDC058000 TaxID=3346299 RepID=UPI0036E0473E
MSGSLESLTGQHCPLGRGVPAQEADVLAGAARGAGVRHAIGLQARYAPALPYARELVANGRLGRVTSPTVHAARGKGVGTRIPDWAAYTLDRDNGAGTLEVAGGHTLDALQYVRGDIRELSASLSVQRPVYTTVESGAPVEPTSPDHLLLNATLTSGAVVSAHIHDAKVRDARTRLEISGTEGDLAVVSGPAGIQIGTLRLRGTGAPGGTCQELPVPDRHRRSAVIAVDAEGFNVAQAYAHLAHDLRTGSHTVPDFDAGLRLHRLLDTIRHSADTGTRQFLGTSVGSTGPVDGAGRSGSGNQTRMTLGPKSW